MSSLSDLVAQISTASKTITDYLEANKLAQPSFAADSPSIPAAPEIQDARMALIQASAAISQLAMGPTEYLKWSTGHTKIDQLSLEVATDYGFFDAVPLEGEASYADIGKAVGLDEEMVRRTLRHTMTLNIFKEENPGMVKHTSISAAMVTDPRLKSWVLLNVDEGARGATHTVEAMRRFPACNKPWESGFGLAYGLNENETYFSFLANDGEGNTRKGGKGWRMKQLAEFMALILETGGWDGRFVHEGFDWNGLGNATIIGGSAGHLSFDLASRYPQLTCVVQDFASCEAQFEATCPLDLKNRVTFQAYDFFTPQPVKSADVYIFKQILHDWPDALAVKILQQLPPTMKAGSRVLVIDGVMPPPGVLPVHMERGLTSLDLHLHVIANGKERRAEDWHALFKSADERWDVKDFVQPPGASLFVIEAVWMAQ